MNRRGLLARAGGRRLGGGRQAGSTTCSTRGRRTPRSAAQANTCSSGWTAMCCTIHHGVNQCPPGSFAGGWWKAEGASLCGGKARYYVDCQAECTHCGCHGSHLCSEHCWDCKPHCASRQLRRATGLPQRVPLRPVRATSTVLPDRCCAGRFSCTPPWQWANCSTAAATDNFTVSHSAPCLPRWTAIQQRYTAARLGRDRSLGASVERRAHGPSTASRPALPAWPDVLVERPPARTTSTGHLLHRVCAARRDGLAPRPAGHRHRPDTATTTARQARFQHGGHLRRPRAAGAHGLWGAIWTKWQSARRHGSASLGYPTTDLNRQPLDGNGHFVLFTGGAIYQRQGQPRPRSGRRHRGQVPAVSEPAGSACWDIRSADQAAGDRRPRRHRRRGRSCENGAVGDRRRPRRARRRGADLRHLELPRAAPADELGFPITDVVAVTLTDGPGPAVLLRIRLRDVRRNDQERSPSR